jgi:hypothetical protein
MCLECAAAIYILTLVIAFFCFAGDVPTTFSVGGSLALWAMHHLWLSLSKRSEQLLAYSAFVRLILQI